MRRMGFVCGAATVAAAVIVAAPAQSSQLGSPSTDWAHALAIQKDGKLVAAGLSRVTGRDAFALARYTGKGHLDSNFGRGGKVLTGAPTFARAVAVQPDGKIVIAGWKMLVRYTARGALDSGFGRAGKVATDIDTSALAIGADGRIVVAGRGAIARYTARGTLDARFGKGGKVPTGFDVTAVVLQADRRIVASGRSYAGYRERITVARYAVSGKLDPSFGKGGKVVTAIGSSNLAAALALQSDGKIVAAGWAGSSPDFAVIRYTANGKLDADFGDGGKALTNFGADPTANSEGSSDLATGVAVEADGKIVVAGSSDVRGERDGHGNSRDDFALARYNEDGSLDATFGEDGKVVTEFVDRPNARESSSKAQAVAIQTDGKIVAAGLAAGYDFGLARYSTRGRLDASFGSGGKVATDFGSR